MPRVLHQDGSAAMWLIDPAELEVVHDHFVRWAEPGGAADDDRNLRPPIRSPPVALAVTLRCDLAKLSLYGGADFANDAQAHFHALTASPDTPAPGKLSRRMRAAHLTLEMHHSVLKLMHFDAASSLDGPQNGDASSSSSIAQGASHGGVHRRRIVVCAKDFCVLDRVQGSVFSHLLAYFEDERRLPRPSHVDMLHLQIDEGVTPIFPDEAAGPVEESWEYRVDLRLLPLRLTIDQDVVEFLTDFVQLCTLPTYVEEEPCELAPAGAVDVNEEALHGEDGALATAERPVAMAAKEEGLGEETTASVGAPASGRHAVYLRHLSVGALLLSVDYRAKRLDVAALRRGELWELVNLLPLLEGLEIAFRSVTVNDVTGLSQALMLLVNAWSADLNRTQILRSLTGVTPIRSIANIGEGFAEMVLEPLKEYRAGQGSHRVSKALLRGLLSFLKHVTVESIDLTERICVGTQSALEYVNSCVVEPQEAHAAAAAAGGGVGDAVGPARPRPELLEGGDGTLSWTPVERGAAGFLQPNTAGEGLQQACTSIGRGMRHAGQAVVVRPLLELRRGAPREKVLKSVVSGIPVCVLRPAIGATSAAATALRGVRNSVDPMRRREVERKYRGPE